MARYAVMYWKLLALMDLASSRFQEQNNAITHDIFPFLVRYEVELFCLFPSLFRFAGLFFQCHSVMLQFGPLFSLYLLL